jgi:hypothetical protein
LAARNGYADCARLLLDAGADKEAQDLVRANAGFCVGLGGAGPMVMADLFVSEHACHLSF